MLKIVTAAEPLPVGVVTCCIYGEPGSGKSSLAQTARDALVLDFDRGAQRAIRRADVVPVGDWGEVERIGDADLDAYATVVVDTAGKAADMLMAWLVRGDAKLARRDGSPTLQGFGALKSGWRRWYAQLAALGKDIVLVCHASESKRGDELVSRLDMLGGSRDDIYKAADMMGHLRAAAEGVRVWDCRPTAASFGKDAAGWGAVSVSPDDADTLARAIDAAKARLGRPLAAPEVDVAALTAEAKALAESDAPKEERRALLARAKKLGAVWDRDGKAFRVAH